MPKPRLHADPDDPDTIQVTRFRNLGTTTNPYGYIFFNDYTQLQYAPIQEDPALTLYQGLFDGHFGGNTLKHYAKAIVWLRRNVLVHAIRYPERPEIYLLRRFVEQAIIPPRSAVTANKSGSAKQPSAYTRNNQHTPKDQLSPYTIRAKDEKRKAVNAALPPRPKPNYENRKGKSYKKTHNPENNTSNPETTPATEN